MICEASICALLLGCAQPAAVQPGESHWGITLGQRVWEAERGIPVVDKVVLVPDAATYLDELSRWSPRGRWPVLIEDDRYASLFIRRFRPTQVVRRESVGGKDRPRQETLEAVVANAWPEGHVPAGIVVTSVRHPAWTAAVALAAGHGQPLAWLDDGFGKANATMAADALQRLQNDVTTLVAEAGHPWGDLGDAIETITICRTIPGRVNISDSGGTEIRAVTDLLGRHADGRRYAFAGWIFGDEIRCAYTAMCSLFLHRDLWSLYNTYSDERVNEVYGPQPAAPLLAERGFEVRMKHARELTLDGWLKLLPGGLATDVLVMNSRGNPTLFFLADERGWSGDVPVLDTPVALHFTHSFSLKSPANTGTIGGQWLEHGVYAYIGSVDEPQLAGFVPPMILADRCRNLVPFLVAGRRWPDAPWKINTLGDPLMICVPPLLPRTERLAAPPIAAGETDVREEAKQLMRLAAGGAETERAAAMADTVRTLELLGQDTIVLQMWAFARQEGLQHAAARGALAALFRAQNYGGFVEAWQSAGGAAGGDDDLQTDMLWHLLTPRIRFVDEDTLVLLQTSIRECQSHEDLRRLAPHLTSAFGAGHVRVLIQRELDRTTSPQRRRMLQEMLQ